MINKLKTLAVVVGLAGSLSFIVGVTTGCSGDKYHRSTGTYLDDKSLTTKVKTELLADPAIKSTQIKVKTYQGTVQLSGFVDNDAQKQRAAEIARRVQGVQTVNNNIIVKNVPSTAGTTNKIQEPAGGGTTNATNQIQEPAGGQQPPAPKEPAPVTTPPETPPAPTQPQPAPAPAPENPPANPAPAPAPANPPPAQPGY